MSTWNRNTGERVNSKQLVKWGDNYLDIHPIRDSLQLCLACRHDAAFPIPSGIQRRFDLEPRRALDIEVPGDDDAFTVYIWVDGVGTFILDTYRNFTSTAVKPNTWGSDNGMEQSG